MATKKNSEDHSQVKALTPRDIDVKYMGAEPLFVIQPNEKDRGSEMARAFAWYNRFYNKKEAKEMLAQYLDLSKKIQDAKVIRRVAEGDLLTSYCWIARMKLRGLVLTEHEELQLSTEIIRLMRTISNPETREVSVTAGAKKEKVEEATRPNIQEIMREKAKDAAGELEGMFDEFVLGGSKINNKLKPMDEVAKKNVMPQHIGFIADTWKKKQVEFEQVIEGKDRQLVEAYSHLSKIQLRNSLKFIESVINDLNSYSSVKKAAKAPRARKVVPVEKIVAKLKYLKTFKDVSTKLDLVSISPVKLHGASEAWAYDTAKRKLHHYIADEYSKTFTVKGNTLLGFDTTKSEVKTLRKPNEQIKEIMGSKPVARKYFSDIKAVSTTPNGRFNESILILKAW